VDLDVATPQPIKRGRAGGILGLAFAGFLFAAGVDRPVAAAV
jgi:hypothetical protein